MGVHEERKEHYAYGQKVIVHRFSVYWHESVGGLLEKKRDCFWCHVGGLKGLGGG